MKWGLRASDGAVVEAVLIAHAAGRRTVCVSSQAGCALGCRFCATGAMGAGRDLTAAEIVDQAVLAAREAGAQGARLTNAVFMGMGEPLQGLEAVLAACEEMAAPEGLGMSPRRIAVSTVGWVPGIARLAEHPLPSDWRSPCTPPTTARAGPSCRSTSATRSPACWPPSAGTAIGPAGASSSSTCCSTASTTRPRTPGGWPACCGTAAST